MHVPTPQGTPLPRCALGQQVPLLLAGCHRGWGSGSVTPVGAWRALVAAGGSRWPRWRPCESAGDSCAKPSRGRQGQAGCKAPAAATASPPLGGPCLTLHPWGGSRYRGAALGCSPLSTPGCPRGVCMGQDLAMVTPGGWGAPPQPPKTARFATVISPWPPTPGFKSSWMGEAGAVPGGQGRICCLPPSESSVNCSGANCNQGTAQSTAQSLSFPSSRG